MLRIKEENKKIWMVGNKKEEVFLRRRPADFIFSESNRSEIDELIRLMRQIMTVHRGIGLSANQIGLDAQIFVCQLPDKDGKGYRGKFYTVFNPRIDSVFKKNVIGEEGCLSIPGIYGQVPRAEKVILSGYDRRGNAVTLKAERLLARIFQHEVDHLNGILFIDKTKNIYAIEEVKNFKAA